MGYKLNPETGEWTYDKNSKKTSSSNSSNSNKNSSTVSTPSNSSGETKAIADSLGSSNSSETTDVDGTGTSLGNTRIKKYGKCLVTGIAKSFEGIYYFSQVKHTINGSGFKTEFSVKANYSDIGKKTTSSGSSSSSSGSKNSSSSSGKNSSGNKNSSSSNKTKYKYVLDPETGKYKKIKA